MLAGWVGRDHCCDPAFRQPITEALGVVGPIGKQPSGWADRRQEIARTGKIMGIAGCDQECNWASQIVCQRVDFCRAPATRAADRVMEGPPFAPAAERCALICVESIAIVPILPVEPVSA